ncbi:hypothetical protein, partial [Paractinoplanes rishiriensis]|uniref:hypothetical protein n=1 Tax=Paractinoplanes rishiriensis TaxID=1050105 RepID=UPI001940884E
MDSRQALRIAAGLGPYFTWDPWDGAADWQPLTTLSDPEVLAERVAIARQALLRMSGLPPEAIPERVVASIVFLGLASRLLSPLLAAASIAGALPAPTPESMWWRPAESGPIPIAVRDQPAPGCAERDAETIADDINRSAVHGLVEPVLTAVRARFAVSPQVLWGNVASALGGAASMIADAVPDADAAPAPVPTSTPGSGSAPGSASASA